MKEKKLGRVFKVGDKVKLTKAGEECGFFATEFREGDTAEVMELNKFDGSIYRVMVTSGEAKGYRQTSGSSAGAKSWFEHIDDKKTRKKKGKKRKYFRMGDLVVLKDEVNTSEVSIYNNIQKGVTAMINSEEYNGVLKVHFFTKEGYESDRVKIEALRLATKEERKALRKHKIAKITYDTPCDNVSEQIEQDTEDTEKQAKIPPEYDVKVEDIVEVTVDVGGYLVGTIGQVDIINEDIEGYHNHVVICGTDGDCWNECNVKLLYRPNRSVCGTLNYSVKVGDIVEVTENVSGHSVGKLGEVTELLFCPDNPETRNIAIVTDFLGMPHIEHNVKLIYRKPETNSK